MLIGLVAGVVWTVSARPWAPGAEAAAPPWQAPEFTHTRDQDWINSRPLELAGLEGRVVLLDFWTYGCWNCRRSVPWLETLTARFPAEALVVVGVHTPEFKHEADPAGVRRQVRALGLRHPVMLDNDFSYWEAMGSRHWPTFYLIDKSGRVRQRVIGEVRPDSGKAAALESRIRVLLAESA